MNLCFGRSRLPRYIFEEYSLTDGVHPWGAKGVSFLGGILYAWWRRYDEIVSDEVHERTASNTHSTVLTSNGIMNVDNIVNTTSIINIATDSNNLRGNLKTQYSNDNIRKLSLPEPIYITAPVGTCTRCESMTTDADAKLKPFSQKGFRIITRMKVGYGGFNPNDTTTTKSFKKSYQADKVGATISFKFYGSSVKVAIWQRRDGMGILLAEVDGDSSIITKASGFFKGKFN